MTRLAFYTFGILNAPRGSEHMKEFWGRTPTVFEKAEAIPGFIGRSGYPGGVFGGGESWGLMVNPRFYSPEQHHGALQTLSLWHDLESVSAFSYYGPHADALRMRHDWFSNSDIPLYVAWWVADDHTPTWEEGATQFEALTDNGPTPEAFDLAHPFDAQGNPIKIDRGVVREKRRKAGI